VEHHVITPGLAVGGAGGCARRLKQRLQILPGEGLGVKGAPASARLHQREQLFGVHLSPYGGQGRASGKNRAMALPRSTWIDISKGETFSPVAVTTSPVAKAPSSARTSLPSPAAPPTGPPPPS